MSDDTISRQSAIDAMIRLQAEDIEMYGCAIPEGFDGDRAAEELKALPSVQPEQWIPCERELPEVGRSVLISVGGMYTAEGCLREDGDWV